MYYDATGKPTDDGDFEMVNGSLIVRSGRSIKFNPLTMDSAPNVRSFLSDDKTKSEEPKSIDEALQQAFKTAAEKKGRTVAEWLAQVSPKEIDEIVAQVSTAFVRAHAGKGIAAKFGG